MPKCEPQDRSLRAPPSDVRNPQNSDVQGHPLRIGNDVQSSTSSGKDLRPDKTAAPLSRNQIKKLEKKMKNRKKKEKERARLERRRLEKECRENSDKLHNQSQVDRQPSPQTDLTFKI